MIVYKSKKQLYELIFSQLDGERQSFVSHWKELSEYIVPRRAKFDITQVNKGERINQKIIDNTATLAARTLRSGMMSGITSPARPWFRLTTQDPELSEYGPVKNWISKVQNVISTSYLKSNFYTSLLTLYGDIGVFGTSAMLFEKDVHGDVFYTESFPIGSYWIAKDSRGRVNTFIRNFRMTVRQLLETFGQKRFDGNPDWSNFSIQVRNMYEQGNYESWIDVRHVIVPNPSYNPKLFNFKNNKKYISSYYEIGNNQDDLFLRESGYDYFPVLVPRWEVTSGEDVYGTNCPGMEALGDIKQLQHGEKRTMEAIDKMVRPPMTAPSSLRNQTASILAGDITYVDSQNAQHGFRPAFEVEFRIQEMEMKQNQVRNRIQRAFFEDLFLMLAQTDRRQITAREIEERHEEKLLALGPVLEQLNQDLLDPVTELSFNICAELGLLPTPPQEIQGQDLKVEYISIMAQAQKLVGISSIERFASFSSQVASSDPSILDKIKTDQLIDVYADITSIPSNIIRTDDEVNKIRNQRASSQAKQQQIEQQQQQIQSAQSLSQIKTDDDNYLNQMLKNANAGAIL